MFKYSKGLLLGVLLGSLCNMANAGCLENAKKYEMSQDLYDDCLVEAKASDKNPELHYLFGLWNLSGIKTPTFEKAPDKMSYRHFMYLAATAGNAEAKSLYVITEYTPEAAKEGKLPRRVINFLDDLARDKTPEGILLYYKTKIALDGLDVVREEPILKKMANDKDNVEAQLVYARFLNPKSNYQSDNPNVIEEAKPYYEMVINNPNAPEIYRANANWDLFNFYAHFDKVELRSQSEKYLSNLAYLGDLYAQILYARTYTDTMYGKLDLAEAYAWMQMAKNCQSRNKTLKIDYSVIEKETAKMTDEDKKRAQKLISERSSKVICNIDEKPIYKKDKASSSTSSKEAKDVKEATLKETTTNGKDYQISK